MPNWCANNLIIEGDKLEIKRAMKMLKDENGELTFDKAVPMPLPLKNTTAPAEKGSATSKHNIEKYGAADWYEWRVKNWGVKWDASESDFYDDDAVTFQTPWGPPLEFIKKFSLEFPSLEFKIQFADEFCGAYPLGEAHIKNGEEELDLPPKEGSKRAERMASDIWDGVWVLDWKELEEE